MTSPSRSLFVTGAGGFVGAAIVRAALDAGHRVAALVRTAAPVRLRGLSGDLSVHVADLADRQVIATMLVATKPEIVIHSAWEGVGGPHRAGDIQFANIATTCALADAAIAAGVAKFVGIGSQAEYGRFDRRITEADLPAPTMLYGAAKLSALHLARQRCAAAAIDFAWLRLFSVYGPGDNPAWLIPSVTADLLDGRAPLTTEGRQLWDYLHIDDVARGALAAAVVGGANGVFNLSSGDPVAVRTIIEILRDHAAPGLPLRFGDRPYAADQIMHLEGDNSRLRAATGWAPGVAIGEGLGGLVAAMRRAA